MKLSIFNFFQVHLKDERPIHAVDRGMAKRYIKQRLKQMYPQLRSDPVALERAYEDLGLEPRERSGKGGCTVFEITFSEYLL